MPNTIPGPILEALKARARKAKRAEKAALLWADKPQNTSPATARAPRRSRSKPRRGQPIPPKTRLALKRRSGGRCEARIGGCEITGTEAHHRKLRSRGGSNALINLLLLCHTCHQKVTDNKPWTGAYRTHSYQTEGTSEYGVVWQPEAVK